MAKTKKTTATTKKPTRKVKASPPKAKKEEILSTEQEVWDVIRYAKNIYEGVYTPDLTNARMKDVTMNPAQGSLEDINKALSNPKESEEQLVGYSQWLELNSMLYKRVLLYFSGLLSFDWTYTVKNAIKPAEYGSAKFKKDLRIVEEFFDRFDAKEIFGTAMRQMLRNETFFGILRDEGEKSTIQELPRSYCKITGRFDYGFLFDFDMNWFLSATVPIDMYPPIFRKMYVDALESGYGNYNPTSTLGTRDGTWSFWSQTSPKDGFVAFKLFPEIATNVPFLAPFMPDAVTQPVIRALQLDSYVAQATKLITGQVPFLKDAKTNVKDAIALDPVTLGKFLALMKSALPNAVKILSAPLDNIGSVDFDGNNDIYDSYLSTSSASAGVNSRLIYTKDRQNVLETKASMDVDQNILRPVYKVFSTMLEYWVNRLTKHYKFKFTFEGFNTSTDREERLDGVMKYAETGLVLEQKFASAMGMTPFDMRRQMEEAIQNDFVQRLTPILKASQMSADDANSGRPEKKDGKKTDSGGTTTDVGSNEEKGEI